MSRVVVAWKPLSAKAWAAACRSRSTVVASGSEVRVVVVGCDTLTACRREGKLSKRLVTDGYRAPHPVSTPDGGRHAPKHLRRGPRGDARVGARVRRPNPRPSRPGDDRGQVDPTRHLARGGQAGLPRPR